MMDLSAFSSASIVKKKKKKKKAGLKESANANVKKHLIKLLVNLESSLATKVKASVSELSDESRFIKALLVNHKTSIGKFKLYQIASSIVRKVDEVIIAIDLIIGKLVPLTRSYVEIDNDRRILDHNFFKKQVVSLSLKKSIILLDSIAKLSKMLSQDSKFFIHENYWTNWIYPVIASVGKINTIIEPYRDELQICYGLCNVNVI